MLSRDTEWRQGNLLTDGAALALKLVEALGSGSRVVVISHDCDLPNDTEEFVEVIVGSKVDAPNAMLVNAKNPRRLHVRFTTQDGEEIHIELHHANRRQVKKIEFSKFGARDSSFALPTDEKRALKQWLAARYGRPAFPSAFETRLRKIVQKKSVEHRIAKILEPASSHLVALFFDLGEDRTVELPGGEAYFLSISVVYDATEGGQHAREVAENVADELNSLFEQAYGTAYAATEIALESCNAVADTFMTLADLRKVDQWRLEYISLQEDPVGNFLPTGELSV
ncbi:MAG: hypothetical protein HO274_02915 [Ferrovum myxofaciens]|uniref:hypothetical protein n=1 Tax=Ferrovum myxofaciens TaxID=416213 RepID=UPI002354666C|nr:hypothetical protein [Ferrovum myxofaciens]QKE40393.1 MAG: hypothetical protein HO274_02915 [Ferrovum myxofaciens]